MCSALIKVKHISGSLCSNQARRTRNSMPEIDCLQILYR
jgi:hypothetical protein